MPARVYVCDSSKASNLKKLLEYDPYLDQNLIPSIPKEWDDPKYFETHPETKAKADEQMKKIEESRKKLLNDEDMNIIFARQDYLVKEGISLELDREKIYLYLSASEDFLVKAEKKLRANIEGIQRVDAETEKKIIATIDEERLRAESGIGLIF